MDFESTVWLWLLPFVTAGFLWLYAYGYRRRRRRLSHFAATRLMAVLSTSFSLRRLRLKQGLLLFSIVGLLLGLARPKWGHDWETATAKGTDILFALDSSKSMLAEDILPNRLERARLAILDLIQRLESDRVGLIAFAGSAFLECPLTLDYDAFRQALETVDTSIIPQGGTDIAVALREAASAFSPNDHHKTLILLTDGEDLKASGIESAQQAAESGITVYTIGIGSNEGELIPIRQPDGSLDFLRDAQGNVVKTRLDETTLRAIARATGAFYTPLGSTGQGLERLYNKGLKLLADKEHKAQLKKQGIHRFQWPLAAGIIFLAIESLISTRRRQNVHQL